MKLLTIKVKNLLSKWSVEHVTPGYNPIPILHKLCDIFEAKPNECHQYDFDYGPHRVDLPTRRKKFCSLFVASNCFMITLLKSYLKDDFWPTQTKNNHDLKIAASRLLNILQPTLSICLFFNRTVDDQFVQWLFSLAENSCVPLQSCAVGILASCMENFQKINYFKEDNHRLIPIILDRLHNYILLYEENKNNQITNYNLSSRKRKAHKSLRIDNPNSTVGVEKSNQNALEGVCTICDNKSSYLVLSETSETSSSNSMKTNLNNLTTLLVLSLDYLIKTTKHQEFSRYIFKENSLILVKQIISSSKQNIWLAVEAVRFLTNFLCERRMAIEFIALGGLQELLEIPRSLLTSSGVSICFYYLSRVKKAMEMICQLPKGILIQFVEYALCLLEKSNYPDKGFIAQFFRHSFHYSVIQQIFDKHNGLEKLVKVISSLPSYTFIDMETNMNDHSQMTVMYQMIVSLKHYFEAHLHIKAHKLIRSKKMDTKPINSSIVVPKISSIPKNKSNEKSHAEVIEELKILSNALTMKSYWKPVNQLIKCDGLHALLLLIIDFAPRWNYSKRLVIVKYALEVINLCAVLPAIQLLLCKPIPQNIVIQTAFIKPSQKNKIYVGWDIIIEATKGTLELLCTSASVEIQKMSLSIIVTCVCAPVHQMSENIVQYSKKGSPEKLSTNNNEITKEIWNCIRNYNGIMVLLKLMTTETPIEDADAIRGLACQALAGLARHESVSQIISKLPLFNSDQFGNLIKNPVFHENRQEHETFQKYASELLELIFDKTKFTDSDLIVNKNQTNIIAQTKINFNKQELLLLIRQHLMNQGLSKTAELLGQETNLNITEKKPLPLINDSLCQPVIDREISPIVPNHVNPLATSSSGLLSSDSNIQSINSSPINLKIKRQSEMYPKLESEPESKISKLSHDKLDQDKPLQSDTINSSTLCLESIISKYLINQHASCKTPMITCPTFSLLDPHKCPGPKPTILSNTNFAMRFSKNIHCRRRDERLIHSRFCPTLMLTNDIEKYMTCSEFIKPNRIAVGSRFGKIHVINTFTNQIQETCSLDGLFIESLECSNDGALLISSTSLFERPSTYIWEINDESLFDLKYSLKENYCTFSNNCQTKLLGTTNAISTIYDVETSSPILRFVPKLSNRYKKNRAVFDVTNELVFSDGVLWDVNSGKEIHKFDKFNLFRNGIFHPNGLEIISNSEVWDMRTFHLLRSVSSLDKCNIMLSKAGRVMYSYTYDLDEINRSSIVFKTTFQTHDLHDYSNIATEDVGKYITHMACNKNDTQIAIVESECRNAMTSSCVRLYDVGRSRIDKGTERDEDDGNDEFSMVSPIFEPLF